MNIQSRIDNKKRPIFDKGFEPVYITHGLDCFSRGDYVEQTFLVFLLLKKLWPGRAGGGG